MSEWPTPDAGAPAPAPTAPPPAADQHRRVVIRRFGALLFAGALLLDLLGDPAALAAFSKLCGL